MRGIAGYVRTEANMSNGTRDNGEDRGDKGSDRDTLNGGKGWRTVAAADGVAQISRGCQLTTAGKGSRPI